MINLKSYLTKSGIRIHSEYLDTVNLRQSHIRKCTQPYNLIWTSILMMIDLKGATYKTLIVSKDQGLILMKHSTSQIMKDYANRRTLGFEWRCPMIGAQLHIKEYVPYVFNNLQLVPLKIASEHNHPCYLAINHVIDMSQFQTFHKTKIKFENLDLPIVVPISIHFIEQRMSDLHDMKRAKELLASWSSTILGFKTPKITDSVELAKQEKFIHDLLQSAYVKALNDFANYFSISLTEQDEKALCKRHLGFHNDLLSS